MKWRHLLMLVLLAAACQTSLKPLPQTPPRITDSPPEQRAALNEAAGLGLPEQERRFGIEQEKELQRIERERAEDRKSKTAVIPMPAVNRGGPAVDAGTPADGGRDGSHK